MRARHHPTPALLALSLGYFSMGTTSLAVVGLSVPMGRSLHVPPARIGLLVTVFAVTFAIAAPLAPLVFGRWPLKWTLACGLTLLTAGGLAGALAPGYGTATAARVVAAAGGAVFAPLASAAGSSIVAPDRRQQALATVFAGMTIAAVLGVPLAAFGAGALGWRPALAGVAVLSAVSLLLVLALVPRRTAAARPGLAGYRRVARTPGALPTVATTLLFMAAQFVVYAVAGSYLTERFGADGTSISLTLFAFGVLGVLGNATAGRIGDRVGGTRIVTVAVLGVAVAYLLLLPAPHRLAAGIALFALWAFFSQLYQAPQQARLVQLLPGERALILALNAAALYLGMSLGSLLGSFSLEWAGPGGLPAIGLVLLLAAGLAHRASTRPNEPDPPRRTIVSTSNAELVRNYLETVWNQGRTEVADAFLAENLVQHNPNLPDGRAPLVDFIAGLKRQVPGGRFEIHRLVADGDLVVAHTLFTTGDGGDQVVVDIFRVAGGLIVEHWDCKEPVPASTVSGHPVI